MHVFLVIRNKELEMRNRLIDIPKDKMISLFILDSQYKDSKEWQLDCGDALGRVTFGPILHVDSGQFPFQPFLLGWACYGQISPLETSLKIKFRSQ